MTDFRAYETKAVVLAIDGDFQLLIEKLRDPAESLSQKDRDFLAAFLEGKPTRVGRPVKSHSQNLVAYEAVEWLVRIEGVKRDAAEMQVAKLLGETDRNIRKRVGKCFVKGQSGEKVRARFTVLAEWRLQLAEEHTDFNNDFRPSILRNEISAH